MCHEDGPGDSAQSHTLRQGTNMKPISFVTLLLCFNQAYFTDPPCIMELECRECVPDNMPLVTSHRAANGSVVVAAGEEVALECGGGKFLAFPLLARLRATCERGRYRARGALLHLLDLGCQESIFEDVLHQVEGCAPPLQGRAYRMREAGGVRHLAALCFDEDRGVAVRLRASNAPRNRLALPPHREQTAPLSLLGNFNHMFDAATRHDAERLYSDDASLNRRLRELFKHEHYSFAGQSLTSGRLLSGHYFEDQNARAADFVSNRVAVWRSVAEGNLRHVHRDIAEFLRLARPHAEVDVYAGTHGVLSLRAGAGARAEVFLRAGRRFPVPRYIWSVLHARAAHRAVAVVLLNDPFVAVSEIRDAVFCESACGRLPWLHELRRHRNYEAPVNGLVFCCSLRNFTAVVPEMPSTLDVPAGNEGVLTELFF